MSSPKSLNSFNRSRNSDFSIELNNEKTTSEMIIDLNIQHALISENTVLCIKLIYMKELSLNGTNQYTFDVIESPDLFDNLSPNCFTYRQTDKKIYLKILYFDELSNINEKKYNYFIGHTPYYNSEIIEYSTDLSFQLIYDFLITSNEVYLVKMSQNIFHVAFITYGLLYNPDFSLFTEIYNLNTASIEDIFSNMSLNIEFIMNITDVPITIKRTHFCESKPKLLIYYDNTYIFFRLYYYETLTKKRINYIGSRHIDQIRNDIKNKFNVTIHITTQHINNKLKELISSNIKINCDNLVNNTNEHSKQQQQCRLSINLIPELNSGLMFNVVMSNYD